MHLKHQYLALLCPCAQLYREAPIIHQQSKPDQHTSCQWLCNLARFQKYAAATFSRTIQTTIFNLIHATDHILASMI